LKIPKTVLCFIQKKIEINPIDQHQPNGGNKTWNDLFLFRDNKPRLL
jgi:hypothetical protein